MTNGPGCGAPSAFALDEVDSMDTVDEVDAGRGDGVRGSLSDISAEIDRVG